MWCATYIGACHILINSQKLFVLYLAKSKFNCQESPVSSWLSKQSASSDLQVILVACVIHPNITMDSIALPPHRDQSLFYPLSRQSHLAAWKKESKELWTNFPHRVKLLSFPLISKGDNMFVLYLKDLFIYDHMIVIIITVWKATVNIDGKQLLILSNYWEFRGNSIWMYGVSVCVVFFYG